MGAMNSSQNRYRMSCKPDGSIYAEQGCKARMLLDGTQTRAPRRHRPTSVYKESNISMEGVYAQHCQEQCESN